MKSLFPLSIVLLLSLTFPTSAWPDNEKAASVHKQIDRNIDEVRSRFGSSNGLLAFELLLSISYDLRTDLVGNRERAISANVKELLDIYPKIPAESQRHLASQAIDIGYQLVASKSPRGPVLGSKTIACVVKAAAKNHWSDYKSLPVAWPYSLNAALGKVATDEKIKHSVRSKAQYALTHQEISQAPLVAPVVADLEAILKEEWPPKQSGEEAIDWSLRMPSWTKGRPEQPADTPPEKRRATFAKSITFYTFPGDVSPKIRNDLEALSKLYPTLSEAAQYSYCARVLDMTEKLLCTDVHKEADTLFWKVFPIVKIGWLDNGQICSSLMGNHGYFFQPGQLPKAKMILIKAIAFNSAGMGGFTETNLRIVLAQTCDMMGDYNEARQQFQIVRQLNEKKHADALSDPDSYTQNDEDFYKINEEAVEEGLSANH